MAKRVTTGFTLLEMIFVLVIISILATVAIPSFTRSRESALGREAVASLRMIAAAERIYRMELTPNAFVACRCDCVGTGVNCCNAANGCNTLLRLNLNAEHWTYRVTTAAGPSFSARAERVGAGGPGNFLDCVYTLTSAGTDPVPNLSCPR